MAIQKWLDDGEDSIVAGDVNGFLVNFVISNENIFDVRDLSELVSLSTKLANDMLICTSTSDKNEHCFAY